MLPDGLKQDVLDLVAISKECPDNLQGRCFELLLSHYLDRMNDQPRKQSSGSDAKASGKQDSLVEPGEEPAANGNTLPSDSELAMKDLHVKAKKFLDRTGTTIEDLNQIFYKADNELLPLYEDLKTTKAAESQIRIALLHALASGVKSGEFEFDGEVVRKECQTRKCYDVANFSANFKNNADLFEGFDKYDPRGSPKTGQSGTPQNRPVETVI